MVEGGARIIGSLLSRAVSLQCPPTAFMTEVAQQDLARVVDQVVLTIAPVWLAGLTIPLDLTEEKQNSSDTHLKAGASLAVRTTRHPRLTGTKSYAVGQDVMLQGNTQPTP